MSRQDRHARLPSILMLVAFGAWGLALATSPAGGSAATPQQVSVIQGTLEDLELGNLSIRRFRFTAGSRLGWHTHLDGPQLLMMEEGRGRMQERGGRLVALVAHRDGGHATVQAMVTRPRGGHEEVGIASAAVALP